MLELIFKNNEENKKQSEQEKKRIYLKKKHFTLFRFCWMSPQSFTCKCRSGSYKHSFALTWIIILLFVKLTKPVSCPPWWYSDTERIRRQIWPNCIYIETKLGFYRTSNRAAGPQGSTKCHFSWYLNAALSVPLKFAASDHSSKH